MLANIITLIFCLAGTMLCDGFIRLAALAGVAVLSFVLGMLFEMSVPQMEE